MSTDLSLPAPSALGWRVVDIVVAAVLGVAAGLVFWAWNGPGYAIYEAANALTPGLGGLSQGLWLIAGPVGGLIIRKPGAAVFVTVIAATISMALGNTWGVQTLLFGLAEGVGAELAFLIFAYRRFTLPVAVLAGVLAGVFEWGSELFTGNMAKSLAFNLIYLASNMVSGAILAGVLAWLLMKALARTGVLARFAAGRE